MASKLNKDWPVLKHYDAEHLARLALPLGGIGTGTVGLGGRGDLRDWEIMNRPAKGFVPTGETGKGQPPFFALFAKPAGGEAVVRALEGPLDPALYEGSAGSSAPNHGLPRFHDAAFHAAYPLGQLQLSDPDVPVNVRLEAFNPLIPGDAERSGIPVAVLRYVLTNRTSRPVRASVCGTVPNFVGADGSAFLNDRQGSAQMAGAKGNRNVYRKTRGLQGIFMDSAGVSPEAEAWGSLALTTPAAAGISHRTNWARLSWGDSLLDFWDDFSADGRLDEREADVNAPMASLSVATTLPPRGSKTITFLLTWHFPNRATWTPALRPEADKARGPNAADHIGNYYTTRYTDAWDVAAQVAPKLTKLEQDTVAFVAAFCASDLPAEVKEAALFNVSTLRTQTCFRTPDGRFYGWEGCCDHCGCCYGSCTHVWNYEQATAFLFGDLARTMREVEFAHATRDDGLMSFRVNLPIARGAEQGKAAADGQMGCFLKLYRDWQLSGDDALLTALWPKARKALEFCWLPGGWDADRDGVMEGCQHNTMDVEYYGPNPQMGIWYLGALRAAEEMARHLGEADFADQCHALFESGRRWTDENLFNGDYYEHEIRPPTADAPPMESLLVGMGSVGLKDPVLQLGAGCLVDQLVGQFLAHVCGLGYLVDRRHVRTTLKSIMKHNFKPSVRGHFNHLRSFVLGDESALLMGSYPRGRRPTRPFPYYNEVMTGFEYCAGVHMLYEGQTSAGLKVIGAVRDRYDGRKRNPFDEAECGHHYARAMSSWAAVPALSGFRYSGVTRSLSFAPRPGTWFWSNGSAWGTCRITTTATGLSARLTVLHGELTLDRFALGTAGEKIFARPVRIRPGKPASWRLSRGESK